MTKLQRRHRNFLVGFGVAVILVISFLIVVSARKSEAQTDCDSDCLSAKVEALSKRLTAVENQLGINKKTKSASTKEYYVALASGSTLAIDWSNLPASEFWLDLSLYGAKVETTWQGWAGGGSVELRLYDLTNRRVVDGSAVKVNGGDEKVSFYSRPLSVWRGQNQYAVQVRSLTGGEVSLSEGKLKLVVK